MEGIVNFVKEEVGRGIQWIYESIVYGSLKLWLRATRYHGTRV